MTNIDVAELKENLDRMVSRKQLIKYKISATFLIDKVAIIVV